MSSNTNPGLIQYQILKRFDSIRHFTTTRLGGVSVGNYSSFNLGLFTGDLAENISQNFELLKNLSIFKDLASPILLGISRKSFIYKTLGISAADALNGTTVLNTIGLSNGVSILRVHDVRAAREAIELVHAEMK